MTHPPTSPPPQAPARARLLLLNGPPGVGKSTLARRWAAARPGTLLLDPDLLRPLVGAVDPATAAGLTRTLALAMAQAHLAGGRDVALPQYVGRADQLDRFAAAARDAGAVLVHVVLEAPVPEVLRRFHERTRLAEEPWHVTVAQIVAAEGGDVVITDAVERLARLSAAVPGIRTLACDGSQASTAAALDRLLDDRPADRPET